MAGMTIRDLDDDLKRRLRIRAARHGRSMEEEVRAILRTVLSRSPRGSASLVEAIRARFEPLGGVELEIAPRESLRTRVDFSP